MWKSLLRISLKRVVVVYVTLPWRSMKLIASHLELERNHLESETTQRYFVGDKRHVILESFQQLFSCLTFDAFQSINSSFLIFHVKIFMKTWKWLLDQMKIFNGSGSEIKEKRRQIIDQSFRSLEKFQKKKKMSTLWITNSHDSLNLISYVNKHLQDPKTANFV